MLYENPLFQVNENNQRMITLLNLIDISFSNMYFIHHNNHHLVLVYFEFEILIIVASIAQGAEARGISITEIIGTIFILNVL